MNTPVRKVYFIIPVLYLILAGFFAHIGLDHETRSFTIQKGSLSVSGSGQEGLDKNSLSSFVIHLPGMDMDMFKNSVYLVDDSGNRKDIKVTGYSFASGDLAVSFTDSVRMDFIFNPEGTDTRMVKVELSVPDEAGRVAAYVPAEAKFTMNQLSFLPAYSFSDRGKKRMYAFPAQARYDTTAGIISIPLENGKAVFSLFDTGETDPVSFYFFGKEGPVNNGAFEAEVEGYITDSYNSWRGERLNPDKGQWKEADGSFSFDNTLITALIAEDLKRGRYSDAQRFITLAEKQKDSISYLSAPFTGRIVVTDEMRQERDDALKKEISTALREKDYSVFLREGLIEELNWISSSALFRTFNSFAASLDLDRDLPSSVLAGMIEVYRDVIKGNKEQFHDVQRLFSVIESHLYPHLTRTAEGLFLLDDGKINLRLSLKTGLILRDIGQMEEDPLMSSIGRTLVVSTLKLREEDGRISLHTDDSTSFYGGALFYKIITGNEYYPHVDLFNDVRVWSAAKDITLRETEGSYIFDISFPREISQHLVIKGIPPFKVLKMHGIPWNSDRRFQYYTSGWVYNENERTLYMKLNQRKSKERIEIEF